ncbi:MAG: ComEC/Rec2 family competence protein [Alphaproteobacteria bacterium]
MAKDFKIKNIGKHFGEENRSLFFWAAVLYGVGIGFYFLLPVEPPIWPPLVFAGLLWFFLGWFKKHNVFRLMFKGALMVTLGFAAGTIRTAMVDTKTLGSETRPIVLEGSVELVEDRLERGLRLTLKNLKFENGASDMPKRIRITIRTAHPDLRPGMIIKTRVILLPLPEPVIPGGYDFARQLWFNGLGAVGFAVAEVEVAGNPKTTLQEKIEGVRQSLFERITKAAPGPGGAVAAALITGIRDGIPERVSEDMRIAGLAHLLAISGLHMALVTGFLFIALQSLMALIPKFALRFQIKKFAAVGAFLGALGYLVLSGASLSTQRAFIMVAIVLLAVLVDRRAISMRLVSIAAIAVLTINPEALLHPSFQMSFAAVTGLVAGYAWLKPWFSKIRQAHPGPLGKSRLYVLGVMISTLIAEVTIGPIALYHFGRFSVYGLAANLLAVPIMGFLVMPLGLLGLVLVPVGLDSYLWQAMAFFMGLILDIAHFIAGLPNADFMFTKIPVLSLVFLVFAGLWLCLWQSTVIRRWAFIPLLAGVFIYAIDQQPDVVIGREGRLVALKGAQGNYYFSTLRAASFSRENWQRTFGQKELLGFPDFPDSQTVKLACDTLGCLYQNGKWKLAIIKDPSGFAEDCVKSDIILTSHYAPFPCKDEKRVIDRSALRRNGAHAIWFKGAIRIKSGGQGRGRRPWTVANQ